MGAAGRMAFPLRLLIGILGIAGILVGLFLIAVGIAVLGGVLLRFSRSR